MNENLARKIVNREELVQRATEARDAGLVVVQCHGCFDIVHPGHLRYLEFAHRQGDILIVSVTGDNQIDKGSQRPFIPQELRAENLAALEYVDWVYINPNPTAVGILGEVQPHIYVKGAEYEHSTDPGFLAERRVVESYGGRVIFSSGEVIFSSTRLLETIAADDSLDAQRLAAVCQRHNINASSIEKIVNNLESCRVLVIGDIILDQYVLCDATEVANEAPMMSLVELERREYLGGAAIVARQIAALGASATLLSACGNNDEARSTMDTLDDEQIYTRLLPVRHSLPRKTRFVVETAKMLRVEKAEYAPLDSQAETTAVAEIEAQLDHVDAVIWCDFGYGMITSNLLRRTLPILRERKKIIAGNVSGPRGNLLEFKNVDLLCPTERQLRTVFHDFEQGLSKVAWEAMSHTRAKHLVTSLAKRGIVAFDRQTQQANLPEYSGRLLSEYLPSFADKVVDSLGAGDAFLAVATLALTAGAGLMQAAYLANAASALEHATLGNVPISKRNLIRWLDGRLELIPRADTDASGQRVRPLRTRAAP